MKFNFRKIASILSSVVMVSSTVAFATAANFSAPFVSGGAADVALVYGSKAANTDLVAVTDISSKLQSDLAAQTATAGTGGSASGTGDFVKIETSSEKLNINESLTHVKTTVIGAIDMPNLLAKKTYQAKNGVSSDYEQEIQLSPSLVYTVFGDLDYNNKAPTLGIKESTNTAVMNYTARFIKTIESDVDSNGRMKDIENTDISLLGKSYKLLNAYNNSNIKLDLMGGAVSDTVGLNEQKDYTIGDKKYTVKVVFVGQSSNINEAKLEVNGQTTNTMNTGDTQTLTDGTQIGIRDILYQNFAGGVMKVEFSLGAEKLTIENGQKVRLNDNQVNSVTGYIGQGSSGNKRTISNIILSWVTNDKLFITQNNPAIFPGLNATQISMGNFTTPYQEVVTVQPSGDKVISLKAPIKSGSVTIPLLSGNGTDFTTVGDDGSTQNTLRTTNLPSIVFNRTTDKYFVASWNQTTAAETYVLKAITNKDSPSSGVNSTDIIDQVTGNTVCQQRQPGQTCTIGNVVVTVNTIDVHGDGAVNFSAGTNVNFNTLFTSQGLRVNLPYDSIDNGVGAINLTAHAVPRYSLYLTEADKDHNIGAGKQINASLSWTSGGSTNKAEVGDVTSANLASGTISSFDVGGSASTSNYVNYIASDLGTMLTYWTKPDQNYLDIEYHGGQSYGSVFLSAPSTTITVSSGTGGTVKELGSVSVADTEAASVSGKNLIVVGGSCVNSVAADLLGGALCGANFEASTGVGAGSFLIQTFARTSGKIATLVAGYNAADTTNAAKYLTTQTVDTTVGKKYKGSSATSASLVTTTA